ncbi:hypothetical protein AURDEDRAFT_175519 [Auricularia subglabra TFB-10046 SS5]|uniref:Uncharacterized protein n=1 Tax=Auricularia subglabra (strain TFB-10046 / SS5) TaxID=717982 RepID=J0WRR4_AURST|nr:hypothetical protein AURDEDRAFT_175519 [Auricularia subglabra TFB-10046 SS5]
MSKLQRKNEPKGIYELTHAEALRRAEYNCRQNTLLLKARSKSVGTSPVPLSLPLPP